MGSIPAWTDYLVRFISEVILNRKVNVRLGPIVTVLEDYMKCNYPEAKREPLEGKYEYPESYSSFKVIIHNDNLDKACRNTLPGNLASEGPHKCGMRSMSAMDPITDTTCLSIYVHARKRTLPGGAPSDYHLFEPMKSGIRVQKNSPDKGAINAAVIKWLASVGSDFYKLSMQALVHRWQKSITNGILQAKLSSDSSIPLLLPCSKRESMLGMGAYVICTRQSRPLVSAH
ncbi:hypothetical protein ANN_03166 [Periplaneta americana]|uniref:Uncharacterized protein n=1 Tax=Periplaneta americana TaxID=6978 RepID=A0ABQ8U0Z2_PERAM|nr:hypothetical protein ANN_03166 [Periplaneta americana]